MKQDRWAAIALPGGLLIFCSNLRMKKDFGYFCRTNKLES